jgi:PAS domain-containing protein
MDQAERMTAGTAATPDEMLATAIAVVGQGEAAMREALDRLPAPIYTTDAQGRITYFNKACVPFAGRTPKLGREIGRAHV